MKKVTSGTVLKELSLLGHAIDVGMKEWAIYLPSNPVKNIRRPSSPKARDRRFATGEETLLLNELKTKTRNDLVHTIVVVAVETAMRRGEILGLEWNDVDLENRTLHLSDTKNGEARDIPLSKKATKALYDLKKNAGDEPLVFPMTPNALKKSFVRALDRAKTENFHFHDLRHEGTSRLFEKGLNIMEVATITGHKDLSMLRRYTHLKAIGVSKKKTDPDDGLNGRSIGYARGKVLGGCSSINAMIYMRGQRSDYDHWAQLGNRGWSWNDVLPVFKRSENYQHGADEYHGDSGELRVEERRVNWEILDAWREAAEQCGIPKNSEFNRGDNFGNAYFQMNQKSGRRWSAVRAFLDPVKSRPNLTIVTETHVSELIMEAGADGNLTATGVRAVTSDGERVWKANHQVLLSAGAVASPQLLQLSGVGPAELLQQNGIEVRRDLVGVGKNLQDHLQVRTIYKVTNTVTLNQRARTPWGKLAMGMEYLLKHTGPLTMPPSQLGAFAKSDDSQESANIEWHVQPLSLDKFGEPLHRYNAITPSVCNLRPTSRGNIQINSPNPHDATSIKLNYLSTQSDRDVAVASLKFTRRIMQASALAHFQPQEMLPGVNITTDEDLAHAAGDLGTTIFHPVGTCKMGNDDASVVDDRLRVNGINHLRVVDASIMPRITSGNTNAPVVMIAEKAAEFIKGEFEHSR